MRQATPDESIVLSTQAEISDLLLKKDMDAVKTKLSLRKLLTTEDQRKLTLTDPTGILHNILLSPRQEDEIYRLIEGFTISMHKARRRLADLEFDQVLLMQKPVLDEKVLLSYQSQINAISNEMGNDRIQLASKIHQVLTPDQLATIAKQQSGKIWNEIGMTADQYQRISDIRTKMETSGQQVRRNLSQLNADMVGLMALPSPDDDLVVQKQKQISQARADGARDELKLFLESRNTLTANQREKLVEGAKRQTSQERAQHLWSGDSLVTFLGDASFVSEEPNVVVLNQGAIMVRVSGPLSVKAGDYEIHPISGTVVLIRKAGNILAVRNIYDSSDGSLSVSVDKTTVNLTLGQEAIFGPDEMSTNAAIKNDHIGRRNMKGTSLSSTHYLISSEVSIISLLQSDPLLSQIVRNGNRFDNALTEQIIKSAAALAQAKPRAIRYSQANE